MSGPERNDPIEKPPYDEVVHLLHGDVYFQRGDIEAVVAQWKADADAAYQGQLSEYQIAFGGAYWCANFFYYNSGVSLLPIDLKEILLHLLERGILDKRHLGPDDFDKILRDFFLIDPSAAE